MENEFLYKSHSIALFAPIEADLKNINTENFNYVRYYEEEAIKCFRCWRKNGGWLANIPIYAICPTKNTISLKTKEKFKELNVTYIEKYFPETDNYDCGFWNIPLVGKWAEDFLEEKLLIKIDLDMYLIKELPKWLFDRAISMNQDIVGAHDSMAHEYLAGKRMVEYEYLFNTGFTLTKSSNTFFKEHYWTLKKLIDDFHSSEEGFRKKYHLTVSNKDNADSGVNNFEYCLLEELAVTFMSKNEGREIYPFENYYLEAEENELESSVVKFDLNKIYFIHEHIDRDVKFKNAKVKIQYAKELGEHGGYRYFLSI